MRVRKHSKRSKKHKDKRHKKGDHGSKRSKKGHKKHQPLYPRPPSQQERPRVYHAVRAVAAFLGACNKQQLLQQLDYLAAHVLQITKYLAGTLSYCPLCNEDMEGALLVYRLVRRGVCGPHLVHMCIQGIMTADLLHCATGSTFCGSRLHQH